jgi:uncharacterized protein (TIGR03067 family)
MRSTRSHRVSSSLRLGSAWLSVGVLFCAGSAAPAQDAAAPASIKYMDADGNDAITRAEWSKFAQSFNQLDGDKDNTLTAEEMAAAGDSARLLTDLADLNRDGKVTRIEWARAIQSFARWDADRNQALSLAELKSAADTALAAAKGSANLPGSKKTATQPAGPTMWRGRIEGRGEIELTVTGNTVVGREIQGGQGGRGLGTGTIVMTGNGQAGNMDATYTEGPQRGETCLGIYQLQGDRLLWCVNNRGGRPPSLAGGNGSWLMTLTRVPNNQ